VDVDVVDEWLNRKSGLLGLSGLSHDMRRLLAEAPHHRGARLAVEVFCYRARKYIGAYLAALGGAQAVVFTGAIGANSPEVRTRICAGMEWCGLALDGEQNAGAVGREGRISAAGASVACYAIPADEERVVARATARLLGETA
jgi:acetate kinase